MAFRKLLSIFIFATLATTASAQALWTSVGGEHKFNKQFSVGIDGEYRLSDGFSETSRWALGLDAEYKFSKHLKASIGYKFIRNFTPAQDIESITMKLYSIDYASMEIRSTNSYWDTRHRAFAAVMGDIDLGRFNISLREMYQYTHRNEASTLRTTNTYEFDDLDDDGNPTWYMDDPETEITTKTFKAKDMHVLRSRLKVDYNIPSCPVDPYASVELFNDLSLAKTRYTVGADWKITKKQTLGVSYFYQTLPSSDDDGDIDHHVISLDYKINF